VTSAIGPALVGRRLGPVVHRWSARDAILYALGVGAVHPRDLPFLYEGYGPQVQPTFALTAITPMLPLLVAALDIDLRRLLHAGQQLAVHRALAPAGAASVTRTITAVSDKGTAALIECEDVVADDDGVLATATSHWWLGGAGGFGGDAAATDSLDRRPAPSPPRLPDGPADVIDSVATTTEQAALYRLSGDLNRVHIDPAFAREAGQPAPILHGLCTMGALGHTLARHAPDRALAELSVRFTAPVFPGERLEVAIWSVSPEEMVATVSVGERVVVGPARATLRVLSPEQRQR
jgi:acyl dehydratase